MNNPASETDNTRHRFVVDSAAEAVKVLRERLGEHARVVSVRQVERGGLSRFLRAPKLEVVAQIEPHLPPVPPLEAAAFAVDCDIPEPPRTAGPAEERISNILRRAGIDGTTLAAVQGLPGWNDVAKNELRSALDATAVLLRGFYQRRKKRPLGNCVAFVGTPGVGKTTALCKRLAADVLLRGKNARVLKLDIDKANPGDGLAVFCEALGVPMLRDGDQAEAPDGGMLYIDLPGVHAGDAKEAEEIAALLGDREATRVLVLNSAYDASLMKQAYKLGESLGATHAGFTHLDELHHWGKLWEFIFSPALQPLFFSSGQNIAGNFTEEVFDAMLDKMFPAVGSEAAKPEFAL